MTVHTDHFSKSHIDKVGKILRDESPESEIYQRALRDLLDWRELHLPAMNEYYEESQAIANSLNLDNITIADRLKRTPTILDKLKRFPHMKLSQLQDAAGIRVIIRKTDDSATSDINILDKISEKLLDLEPKHAKDYIREPKPSGYRGRHFIFESEDKMLVEIQVRTALQHLWATSLETVDFFRGTSMKTARNQGGAWQEFFEYVSSAFALVEGTSPLPQHLGTSSADLAKQISRVTRREKIYEQLATFSQTEVLATADIPADAHTVIIKTNPEDMTVGCEYYEVSRISEATDRYEELERTAKGNIVMVTISDLRNLTEAYPNYFLNLEYFVEIIQTFIDFYRAEE